MKQKQSNIIIVIILILVVLSVGSYYLFFNEAKNETHKQKEDKPNNSEGKSNPITITQEEVDFIYTRTYFNTMGNNDFTLYQNKKITQKDLTDEEKMQMTLYLHGLSEKETNATTTIYEMKIVDLEKSYEQIFGTRDVPRSDFDYDINTMCVFDSNIGYTCYRDNNTDMLGTTTEMRDYIKYIVNGNDIEIYDKYMYLESDGPKYHVYDSRKTKKLLITINKSDIDTLDINKYGTNYKHTYRATTDGIYYWHSSEVVN